MSKIGTEKECPICRGQSFCNCKNQKFIADIVFHFSGEKEAEVNKRLNEFKAKISDFGGASMASYPGASHKNRYDKEIMDKIVDKFVTLMVSYGYTEDEIEEELSNLKGRIDEGVEQYYQEMATDAAYDQMKDDRVARVEAREAKKVFRRERK